LAVVTYCLISKREKGAPERHPFRVLTVAYLALEELMRDPRTSWCAISRRRRDGSVDELFRAQREGDEVRWSEAAASRPRVSARTGT
jgi:hypothetical protein